MRDSSASRVKRRSISTTYPFLAQMPHQRSVPNQRKKKTMKKKKKNSLSQLRPRHLQPRRRRARTRHQHPLVLVTRPSYPHSWVVTSQVLSPPPTLMLPQQRNVAANEPARQFGRSNLVTRPS